MMRMWWLLFVLAALVGGLVVGVSCVDDAAAGPEAFRQFMSGAGPFVVVAGLSFALALFLDDLDGRRDGRGRRHPE